MVEDDIYGNKTKYERFVATYKDLVKSSRVSESEKKYFCKNPENLKLFPKLFKYFETQDLSYSRRLRLLQTVKLILFATDKALADVVKTENRDEVNSIITFPFPNLENVSFI